MGAVGAAALATLIFLVDVALAWAENATTRQSAALDGVVLLVEVLDWIVRFGTLVLVIVWLWRARKNLDAFPGVRPILSAGWAIAVWLIPLANLVLPPTLVRNVATQSARVRWIGAAAVAWWLAFLVHVFANVRFATSQTVYASGAHASNAGLYTRSANDDVSAVPMTVSAVFAVLAVSALAYVVWQTSIAQEERIRRGWAEQSRAMGYMPPSPA